MKDLLQSALRARAPLLERLHAEGTDAYRLFHGTTEGRPGLAVDRYGPLLIAQEFFDPLDDTGPLEELADRLGLELVVRRRGVAEALSAPQVCHEQGQAFQVVARHRGLDPWLFLDFRAGRRWLRAHARGEVLNVFAYTCTAGVAAASAGAAVLNVDFGRWCLDVGRENARLNDVQMDFLREDAFPVLRQLAGLEVKGRAGRRSFTRLHPRGFDLVVLDPPTVASSPFGKVDLVNDYPALLKPCLLALKPGGRVLATNHAADVDLATWLAVVRRTGEKAGRPVQVAEVLVPEEDFPSPDASPPLKMAVLQT